MEKDYRKKGCPNTDCIRNKTKFYYKSTDQFCTICGEPLVLVCKSCFSKIEDTDIKHTRCAHCEAKIADRKEKAINKKNAVVAGVMAIGAGIASAAKSEIIKQGGNAAKQGVKAVFGAASKMIKKS